MTRRIADRYELGAQLGAGGSARVFAARDLRLGRQVAIKLLDSRLAASADSGGRDRFLREGPTSASFHHRHAVTVFDAGEADGELYIVMELVDGPSLAERLASDGALAIDDAMRIAAQVLSALAAAHSAGIVHRDVKPANVLLGADGDVKLADFGIAKRFDELDETVTRVGTVIGTPRYLAPEQAAGAAVTAATDVYAVGILLYEMLTGRTPFAADSLIAAALIQRSQPAPDVRLVRIEVEPRLAATVARALATDPADRYPSAKEMSVDLENAWEPPSDASPESLIRTRVIDLSPLPIVGVRSGDTEVWRGEVPDDPTQFAAPRLPRPAHSAGRARWVVAGVVVAMVVGAGLALFGGSQSGLPGGTTTSTVALGEIIPGFASTTDLEVFLAQLTADPLLVGSAGPTLTDDLRALLAEESSRQQRDLAKDLRKDIEKWVGSGQLDPQIADALDELLQPFVSGPPDK